jgi:hypothetical protein
MEGHNCFHLLGGGLREDGAYFVTLHIRSFLGYAFYEVALSCRWLFYGRRAEF